MIATYDFYGNELQISYLLHGDKHLEGGGQTSVCRGSEFLVQAMLVRCPWAMQQNVVPTIFGIIFGLSKVCALS